MKKNAMLKIAAILMVAVLLTTCAISSTFAKYTTSAEDTVTARVAKFGVTAAISIDDLFDHTYTDGTQADVKTTAKTDGVAIDMILAPGTEGSTNVIGSVSGTPEVAVAVKYEAELVLANWEVDGDVYFPVVFTIGEGTGAKEFKFTGNDLDAFIDDIEEKIASYSTEFAPETNLASDVTAIKIAWKWDFETTDDNNDNDTALGDAAALNVANAAKITLTIKQTISQLDSYPSGN